MDISDKLFDVRPSCSTSTSLNVTGTRDLMQDPVQEKDSNSILIKNIAVKLTRLQSAKEERIKKILKSKRRNRWRHGLLNGKFSKKKKKKVLSSKSSSSQQAFRNAKPDTETISSEDRGNEQINTYLHNQLCHEELYEDAQQNEQRVSNVAQNKTETFNLSTCKTKKEDLYVTYACSRTLPYKFYRKNIIPSSASAIDYCDSLSSSSKDTESSLHSNQSNLIDYLSHKNTKVTNTLIRLRLKLMAKKMKKRLNEWKFKRKSAYSDKYSSDSETEEQRVPNKKCRRIVFIEESDSENETVNNTTTIKDNNRSESHLSVEKIDTKKTCIQFSSPAKVILTKLEKMEDEDVIKWRNSKIKPSDIASESEEQLEGRKLSRNLVASDSQDKLILPTADWFSETQDIPKDSPLINSYTDKRRYAERLKLNKLRKKYKLFKKPRVLLIKLDTLQCSSKDGRYSATEVECLTKEYLNFVINSISKSKPHELTYKYLRLQSIMDANITCMKGHSINSSLSREQSMNESFKCFIEENSIKDVQITENSGNAPFQIHRNLIQNHCKILSSRASEKKNSTLSRKRLELWRNAFRSLIMSEKSQKTIASTSKLITETLSMPQSSPKKSVNAVCENVVTLASTSTSSMKHTTPVEFLSKLTWPNKQIKDSTKPTKCNDTSKFKSSISSKNLPNDANVDKIISKSDLTQSKNDTVSKSPCKNAKMTDNVITLDSFLNSNKKISEMSLKLHKKATNLKLSTNDKSEKSKTSKNCSVEQLFQTIRHKKEESHKCIACGSSFKNYDLWMKHLANNFNTTHMNVNSKSSYASKCIKASLLKIMSKEKKLENSKPSTSKCSSVNEESDSHQLDKLVVNESDVESSSSSSSSLSSLEAIRMRREQFKVSKNKMKSRSAKSKSSRNSSSGAKIPDSNNVECSSSTNIRVKQKITCKICSKSFDTNQQLFEDMAKHMHNDFQNMQTAIENYIISTQESNKTNDQVSNNMVKNSIEATMEEVEVTRNDINESEKSQPENINESRAESLLSSEVSQQDATKEKNKILNLLVAEYTIEQDVKEQSTPATNNFEQEVGKTQCAEKENICDAGSSSELQLEKFFTICECHKPKNETIEAMGSNIYIEIVLLCTTCQTIFRGLECFEVHCTSSVDGTLCNKNRLQGRKSKLLCVSCQQILNSLHDLLQHLTMHSRLNCRGTVTFSCSTCKVIFYSFGPLFESHFQNHEKNSLFLASRLSFPRPSYISSKLIKLPATDIPIEQLYMQIADYVCQHCRMPFIYEQDLKSHKVICESHNVESRIGSSDGKTSITPSKIPILLICGFCNKTFYSRMSFELHSLEHTQKREVHLHYTCVAVTAVTKVYICKVCTTMWQCLQTFREHWRTHSELRAEYICSLCRSYFHSVELFQKHALVHRNNEKKQIPITCEVIYRDISDRNSNINSQRDIIINELPYMNLSYFDNKKNFVDKTVNNKSCESQKSTRLLLKNLMNENLSTQSSVRSNKEATRNIPQVLVQVPSSNFLVTQSEPNNNSRNLGDDSDEDLTIILSESEESSISSGVKRNVDSMPSIMPENTKLTTSDSAITDGQMRCFNDTTSIAASSKTSSYVRESTNLNSQISVITSIESENTQLKTNSSVSKDNNTLENSVDHSVSSMADSSREDLKESSENVMSSMPKAFLRVKSLAELTNTPPEKSLCQMCGMPFESRQKLKTHMLTHNRPLQNKKDDQITSSGNIQVWPTKSMFNPQIAMPTTSTQDHSLSSVMTPSVTVHPNTSVVSTNSRQYQVIGVKPLRPIKYNTNVETSKLKEALHQEKSRCVSLNNIDITSQISQKTAYHQNLPPLVNYPLNKSVQSAQQHQNTGTVAVRPFLQTYQTSKLPPYLQQHSQQLQHPQLMHQQKQHQIQQQPQLQQTQQQQIQQSQLQQQQRQVQQLHQQSQHLQQQLQRHLQLQLQLQQQQQLQHQQHQPLHQQQQLNVGNNIMHYIISKRDMSYQLHPTNLIPTSTDNVMLVTVNTMQQVSQNPDRYICIYCPGFECGSVQEFALHEHSPKHEARSRYNNVTYLS